MADTNIISVNGVGIKTPSALSIEKYDITESKRNSLGVMVMDVVRADISKYVCKWSYLTNAEYKSILNAVGQVYNLSVNLNGTTKTMYVGDKTAPVFSYRKGVPEIKDFTMNFIEM